MCVCATYTFLFNPYKSVLEVAPYACVYELKMRSVKHHIRRALCNFLVPILPGFCGEDWPKGYHNGLVKFFKATLFFYNKQNLINTA